MALVRCEQHSKPKPKGKTKEYIKSVEPVGYPDTALICGIKDCSNPGLVWLVAHEWEEYKSGERIFKPDSATSKFKVK